MNPVYTTLGDELARTIDIGENGVSKSFKGPMDHVVESYVTFETGSGFNMSRREGLDSHLKQTMLLSFQRESILNIVYRPSFINVRKTVCRNGMRETIDEMVSYTQGSDIGVTVINDLLTGSGKTVVSMAAALAFASLRMKEIVDRQEILLREQRPMNWFTRFGARDFSRSYFNAVIVMAAEEVAPQWEKAASNACALLGNTDIKIFRNPKRNCVSSNPGALKVLVFTTIAKMNECFPLDRGFVPCVIVDEYVLKTAHNILTKRAEMTPLFGRLIMVSSDAGDTAKIVKGSRKTSLIRTLTCNGETDNASFRNDVLFSATLMASSIISSSKRAEVAAYMVEGLSRVELEKYTLEYREPVLDKYLRIEPGVGDLQALGVAGVGYVRTAGDLLEKVDLTIAASSNEHASEQILRVVSSRLSELTTNGDTCPVCLDAYTSQKEMCMLSPCWHFVCKKCMEDCINSRDTCPMCRAEITWITDFFPDAKPSSRRIGNLSNCTSYEEFLSAFLLESPSIREACAAVIASLSTQGTPTRLLMICPTPRFFVDLQATLDTMLSRDVQSKHVGVQELNVRQKRRRTGPGFEQRLEWFNSRDGELVKVLCTHGGDRMSGLDLPEIDAICHVGGVIDSRMLGRVTRIPRVLSGGKKLRLFNIVPSL